MATALARGLARGPERWAGVLGHARPGHARRRRRRAGRGLVHARHAGRAARDARGRRARAGRGRRMGGAAHRDGDRAGGALRRRGRRVPDPRPQRLRRPRVRRVGARDRGRALPVPRRRVAAAVDARAAAAAPLAQGRRGDTGGRADGRGRRGPAPGAHAGPPPRRARAAHGVDGPVHVVAVAPPATPPRRAAARAPASPWRSRCSPCCSSGPPSSRRTSRATSTSARSHGSRSSSSSSSPLAALLPATPRRVLAVVLGAVLSLLVLVKVLDIGFFTAFDRPFRPLDDSGYLGIGIETLRDAIGGSSANLVVAAAALLIVALLALPVLALLRVTRVAAGHRAWALRAAAALGVVWVALRVVGAPVASSSAAALAVDEVQARAGPAWQDRAAFTRAIAHDRFGTTPGNRLLTGLRGKDVLVVFVESYGRVAVQDSSFSPRIDAALERGAAQLRAAGFSSRSAFLTSPTFGGLSWLAHSTLQSGVTVDGQWRYDQLVAERPPHPHPGVQARRVAGGRRHAGEPPGVAGGLDLLPLRPGLRPPQLRLPRPGLRPAPHARPVHPAGPATSRARQASPAAALRRGRPHLEPRAVDADSAAHLLGRRRRRLDLRPHPGARSPRRPRSSAMPSGPEPPTGTRSSTR